MRPNRTGTDQRRLKHVSAKKTAPEEVLAVDMTPLIDVVFLLLIFFMLVSVFNEMEREAKLELPDAYQVLFDEDIAKERTIVNVEGNGRIIMYGQALTVDEFKTKLATIAGMLLVNNPGTWSAIYSPFRHAEWHGWTFTDLIFPFFLWIVGLAMTLSFAKRLERGDSRNRLMIHVVRRSTIIFALGLLLAGFPYYNFATIRIPGVLQRIAVLQHIRN